MTAWKTLSAIGFGLALLAAPASSLAHHSAAMFDAAKTVTLKGAVKEWKWMNPHGWIQVVAAGPAGASTEWTLECSSINILARKGWSAHVLKPGDKVSVTVHPMKDGSPAGLVLTVLTADGHTLADHDY